MSRTAGKWKLPQPTDLKDEDEWVPVPRIARTIPFGYEADDNDPDILMPVATELDLLETARKHVKQYSYREVQIGCQQILEDTYHMLGYVKD